MKVASIIITGDAAEFHRLCGVSLERTSILPLDHLPIKLQSPMLICSVKRSVELLGCVRGVCAFLEHKTVTETKFDFVVFEATHGTIEKRKYSHRVCIPRGQSSQKKVYRVI